MSAVVKSVHSEENVKSIKTEEQRTEFCSMDDDCIDYIFDWLTLGELCRLRLTCKRLYLLANEHYRRTYTSTINEYFTSFRYFNKRAFLNASNISSLCKEIKPNLEYVLIWCYYFRMKFNDSKDVDSKEILKNVKGINIRRLDDDLLQHFVNVEYIIYEGRRPFFLSGNYPMVKQFDMTEDISPFEPGIVEFFKRNPNIKVFSTFESIYTTQWLIDSGIKFDDLVLMIDQEKSEDVDKIIKNVQFLYDKQQIKRLHMIIRWKSFSFIPKLSKLYFLESVKAGIPILSDDHESINDSILTFTSLPNLKLLQLWNNAIHIHLLKFLAQNMVELEEIHAKFHQIDHIIPFVRYSAKLKCIYIRAILVGDITITIQMLDKERQKLKNSCKLTIYMNEHYYLKMKNNSLTNSCGLVEIKRYDSYPISKHPLRPNCINESFDKM